MTRPPGSALLAEAAAVYAAAFAQPPYYEGPQEVEGFRERVARYARERSGFRLVTVRDDDGRLDAVGLAVLAHPGDWWRDRIAAVLDGDDVQRWIGDRCLEIVHLAVHPEVQRRGRGRLVHDLLIAGSPAPVAVLSCHPAATPARDLYLNRGWRVLSDALPAGEATFLVLARDL